jgi:hypothetical protein
MTRRKLKHNWRVGERCLDGPDRIFYITERFQTREEAEVERDRLAALPGKAGLRLSVAMVLESSRSSTETIPPMSQLVDENGSPSHDSMAVPSSLQTAMCGKLYQVTAPRQKPPTRS